MKIVITGGHFSPAHSVIKLLENDEVNVIGREHAFAGDSSYTLEYEICQKENIPFYNLNTGKLNRTLSLGGALNLIRFPSGFYEALRLLKKLNPDVVVTFGGYIGLPVALAARILKIPIVLHEQTQKAGLASKLISRFASVTLISFEGSRDFFGSRNVILTGNPLRPGIFENSKSEEINKRKNVLYITGGSTGSHAINSSVFPIIHELLKDFLVYHQTGDASEFNDYKQAVGLKESLSPSLQPKYNISKFFAPDDALYLLKNSELVVSRSGINTVLELIAAKTPAILIPLPTGQTGEQKENAQFFTSQGLGEYIDQSDLNPEKLLRTIRAIIENKRRYVDNFTKADSFIHKDAAEKIVEQIYLYGRRNKRGIKTQEKT